MTRHTRHIGVVTTARSDFGCLSRICKLLQEDPDICLSIFAGGMHFSARHGQTIDEIREAGFDRALVELPVDQADDTPGSVGVSMGRGLEAFTRAFGDRSPDMLLLMGDRFDVLPAVVAAMPRNIPVAHISGGEVTEGQIDEMIRHAITKMSHLHFPVHEAYAARVEQLGEEPWRITVAGHPSLDGIDDLPVKSRAALFQQLELDGARRTALFTYHPETLAPAATAAALDHILGAVGEIDAQILFTYPNSDTGSDVIISKINAFLAGRPDCRAYPSLGRTLYFNLLRYADCMVGNSSSGIVDAGSFALPVVNIGDRQKGRIAPSNVLSVPPIDTEVRSAVKRAVSEPFRNSLVGMQNPYGDGHASERIVARIGSVPIGHDLVRKQFHDLPAASHRNVDYSVFQPTESAA